MSNPETPKPPVPPHVESDDWARVPSVETPITGTEIDSFLAGEKSERSDMPTEKDDQTPLPEDSDDPRTDGVQNFSFEPTDDEPGNDSVWKDFFGIKK